MSVCDYPEVLQPNTTTLSVKVTREHLADKDNVSPQLPTVATTECSMMCIEDTQALLTGESPSVTQNSTIVNTTPSSLTTKTPLSISQLNFASIVTVPGNVSQPSPIVSTSKQTSIREKGLSNGCSSCLLRCFKAVRLYSNDELFPWKFAYSKDFWEESGIKSFNLFDDPVNL